ncbi:hypothetical protein I4U23_005759 [Adineta vaga]|nr:hypothetical protein I4U23_005759 [Adineta vaga]
MENDQEIPLKLTRRQQRTIFIRIYIWVLKFFLAIILTIGDDYQTILKYLHTL